MEIKGTLYKYMIRIKMSRYIVLDLRVRLKQNLNAQIFSQRNQFKQAIFQIQPCSRYRLLSLPDFLLLSSFFFPSFPYFLRLAFVPSYEFIPNTEG